MRAWGEIEAKGKFDDLPEPLVLARGKEGPLQPSSSWQSGNRSRSRYAAISGEDSHSSRAFAGRRAATKVGGCFRDAIRVLEASGIVVNPGGNGRDPGRNFLIPSDQTRPRGHNRRHRHERTDQDAGRIPDLPTRGWQSTPSTCLSYLIRAPLRARRCSPEQQRCHTGRSGRRENAAIFPA